MRVHHVGGSLGGLEGEWPDAAAKEGMQHQLTAYVDKRSGVVAAHIHETSGRRVLLMDPALPALFKQIFPVYEFGPNGEAFYVAD